MAAQDNKKRNRYKDLDLDFLPHPATGDISKKLDAEAIKRSIRTLVLTRFYERLFQPTIGTSVSDLLFDLATPITAMQIKTEIINVIKNHEPRAEVMSVEVNADNMGRSYEITVMFQIVNRPEPVIFNFILERTR